MSASHTYPSAPEPRQHQAMAEPQPLQTLYFVLSSAAMRQNHGNLFVGDFLWRLHVAGKLLDSGGKMCGPIFETLREGRPSIVFLLPCHHIPGVELLPLADDQAREVIRRMVDHYINHRDGYHELEASFVTAEERHLDLHLSLFGTPYRDPELFHRLPR